MKKTLYDQKCPVGRTMNIIGDRWTVMILRDFFTQGNQRYSQLQESLSGIAPNVLSARLKLLEEKGVLSSRLYSKHPPRVEYVLTQKGQALGPIVAAMREWGKRYAK